MNPILIINAQKSTSCFVNYLEEILAIEGIKSYDIVSGEAPLPEHDELINYPLVLLNRRELDSEDIDKLRAYLEGNGSLIAIRPPLNSADLFGLKPCWRKSDALLCKKNTSFHDFELPPFDNLQCLNEADLYHSEGATTIAHLVRDPNWDSEHPAISVHKSGRGKSAAFAFDLPELIVRLHQGDPADSSTGARPDADGDGAYRPNDLFYHQLDPRFIDIPQADLYQDILVALLQWGLPEPLPRIWHFPDAEPTVALINGDSDISTMSDIDKTFAIFDEHKIPFSLNMMVDDFASLEPRRMREYLDKGHDFGPHVYAGDAPSVEESKDNMSRELSAFRERYEYSPVAQRSHSVVWTGWSEHAESLLENGIRLDTNFSAGTGFQRGILNGSQLPVKFCNPEGEIIDVYEQSTTMMDDPIMHDKSIRAPLNEAQAKAEADRYIERNRDLYHGAFHACVHPVYVDTEEYMKPWLIHLCRTLSERGVKCFSSRDWLEFNDARRALRIENHHWTPHPHSGVLEFDVITPETAKAQTLLLPARVAGYHIDTSHLNTSLVRLERRSYSALIIDQESGERTNYQITYHKEHS